MIGKLVHAVAAVGHTTVKTGTSGPRMIGVLALLAGGYALLYYAVDVLVWAHSPSLPTNDPPPLSSLLGLPADNTSGAGPPARGSFFPPINLGNQIPGAITDARGLLGGLPTTGTYSQVSAVSVNAATTANNAATAAGTDGGNTDNSTPGGAPAVLGASGATAGTMPIPGGSSAAPANGGIDSIPGANLVTANAGVLFP